MALFIEWLGHSTFKLMGSKTIYIDPWKIHTPFHDGDIILISHNHHDHFSPYDIKKIAKTPWTVYGPADVIEELGTGTVLNPGDTAVEGNISINATPSYTIHRLFHPKAKNWVGFNIIIDDIKIFYAGDSDFIPEMRHLGPVEIALLPVGGKYTMNSEEAAIAANSIKPSTVIPYHWGTIVGTKEDAESFAENCKCKTVLLDPGEVIEISEKHLEGNSCKKRNRIHRPQIWNHKSR
ncbi:MAG: MBL fold metallo-hydrolase [Bacteroidetes bacterium]|nr:MBL fold metallo-hydrolase [Bacteroidota bacterium]